MKIQLFIQQYKDIMTQFEDCQMIEMNQLNGIPDACCTLLHLGNCCDFVSNQNELLQQCIKKLRYGGQIIVEGTDLAETSFGMAHNIISLNQAQDLLFKGRNSCTTIYDVTNILQQFNLNILKKRLMQYRYFIRAERPNVQI